MLEKMFITITCGISGYNHDKFILPNITLKEKNTSKGYIIGLGWWKWRMYINLFQDMKAIPPLLTDRF